jgi:arylsulfatase A
MATRPNIIFILADDMGYGDFSAFNGGLSSTPVLDSLMDESVCFTQHYTGSPVCNPSRACLLTGRYPHRTGSVDTLEWRGLERLALRERTLADMLQQAGYATGLVGKWHLGAFDNRYHPCNRGFDEAVCFRGGMHDYYDWRLEYGTDQVRRGDGTYLTDVWTAEACDFLRRHQQEPFFLHVTYNAPHTPLQVSEEEAARFRGKPGLNWGVSTLYGMIHRMDSGVGQILQTLDELGLRDNTIVCFCSDNGPQFGGPGDQCTTRFNCHYNGAKGSTYEGGIRVPMLMRWPAGLDPASCEAMVHMSDWLPTLLAMTGVDHPTDAPALDGVNVLPVIRNDQNHGCTQRCWQWNRYTPLIESNAAIRDGDWKLVRPAIAETMAVPDIQWLHTCMYEHDKMAEHGVIQDPEPHREVPPPGPAELYNIALDPLEQTNLAAQEPDVARRLLRDLENWFEEVEAERLTIRDNW